MALSLEVNVHTHQFFYSFTCQGLLLHKCHYYCKRKCENLIAIIKLCVHKAQKNYTDTELILFFGPPEDSTSVATEYSMKFDESMTEDEIEERSFRSLLPSEAHRRGTMEKKSRHHEESEDDGASHNMPLVSGAHNILKVRG